MRHGRRLLAILLASALVVGAVPSGAFVGAVAVGGSTLSGHIINGDIGGAAVTAQMDGINASEGQNSTSRAPVGQQLGTVIAVTDDEVSSDIEASSLDTALENADESERASILASRAATLRDRAERIAIDQRAARAAYENGTLTREEFARWLATLAGRAQTVDRGFARLDERATDISRLELRVAGYDRGANEEARERLGRVMGSGTDALLAQYTGVQSGEFSLEVGGGISIETENDDGERSRELEREQPGDGSFDVAQSEALLAATEPLSSGLDGEWILQSIDRDEDDGYYEFKFSFFGPKTTGEAEVSVDGQTGEVFEFEEALKPRERDDDDDETPLSISIVNGTAEPGATVTLRVTAAGDPVEAATVELDDQNVGTTDADGRLAVTLPDDDEVDIVVKDGEREGELEISLGADDDRDGDDEIRELISASGSVENGTVTVSVTYDDEGISGATVFAGDERVGTTDAHGTASFAAPEIDDGLDITVIKGSLEAEFEFEVGPGGMLTLEDVDKDERDNDEEDASEKEEQETDDEEDDNDEEEQETDDEEDDNDEDDSS